MCLINGIHFNRMPHHFQFCQSGNFHSWRYLHFVSDWGSIVVLTCQLSGDHFPRIVDCQEQWKVQSWERVVVSVTLRKSSFVASNWLSSCPTCALQNILHYTHNNVPVAEVYLTAWCNMCLVVNCPVIILPGRDVCPDLSGCWSIIVLSRK